MSQFKTNVFEQHPDVIAEPQEPYREFSVNSAPGGEVIGGAKPS